MKSIAVGCLLGIAALTLASAWQVPEGPILSVRVASLEPDSVARGELRITTDVQGPADRIAAIEYHLNGKDLGRRLRQSPYSVIWHSAAVWDGPAKIEAVARDVDGNEIARSPAVAFRIANGQGSVRLVEPGLTEPLRGVVDFVFEASHPSGFEAWSLVIDGHFSVKYGNSARQTFSVDTAKLANGPHELFTTIYSKASGHPPVAMAQLRFTTDNGRTPQTLRPTWSEVVLKPGTSARFEPRVVFTDGSAEPADGQVVYESSNIAVATVDREGVISGVTQGSAMITARWRKETAKARVRVQTGEGIPHFSRNGEILQHYDPERSLFVRSLFHLNNDELRTTPGLAEKVRAASINTLTVGLYNNPADNPKPSFDEWRSSWDEYWDAVERDARRYGLAVLLTGDDIARTAKELDNSVHGPWSANAIQHALRRAKASRVAVAVEMIDEVTFLWGDTPLATDAFARLMAIMNGVPGRLPVSWPIGAMSSVQAARNWLGNPAYSDYSSLFFTWMDWRRAYPHSASLPQDRNALERVAIDRLPVLQNDRPILLQTSICGPFYTKRGAGAQFTVGQDTQQEPGVAPPQVAAQIMYAAAAGAAGVRSYSYDWTLWKQERTSSPVGSGDMQTGADPFSVGQDRWAAMSGAFRLISKLEPYLLQTPMNAVDLGSDIVTAARASAGSRLFMAINFSEVASGANVNLRPYRMAGEEQVTRFRLRAGKLSEESIAPADNESVTFLPGETIVWLVKTGTPASTNGAGVVRNSASRSR